MPSPETDSPTPPMFTEAQIRRLKVAVIAMGLVLVLGFLVVIGRIVQLASRQPAGPDRPVASAAVKPAVGLMVPPGAVVRTIALDGDRIAVQYDSPEGPGISVVDLRTGETLTRIRIGPESPR